MGDLGLWDAVGQEGQKMLAGFESLGDCMCVELVAAICHGPWMLCSAKIDGKPVLLPARHWLNLAIGVACLLLGVKFDRPVLSTPSRTRGIPFRFYGSVA